MRDDSTIPKNGDRLVGTGTVHTVGSYVRLFKVGDRVAVGAITPDWGDIASQAGHSSQSGQPLGGWKFSNTKDGVFADYFHVNEADANMARIPDSVPDDTAVNVADMIRRSGSCRYSNRRHGRGLRTRTRWTHGNCRRQIQRSRHDNRCRVSA